ncbi:3-hydroxyisobutyrate dehydrogenase and related beta-hydroxyacid dehydrogenase [Pararhodospirillum photometricum DSM 122]|uniref:3-hydroxyisobutyrate dehydrogenase and related beta-hydroxyacid dehydrogenase n=2 Tax=Pararhodospirillum photometricum TaxID=1084 RepID=H6SKZ5_PARPM|nr:3-hydroxyisobutyrate dehydrogenase and related beta-hydroxyacid dehydrogenase [Pararhodospirillum photometricum DSM 122]
MGGPMARNLLKAGAPVHVFDLSAEAVQAAQAAGAHVAASPAAAAAQADVVVTMLPAGKHVRAVLEGEGGVIRAARPGSLLIDCSTIDVDTARLLAAQAEAAGVAMVDAPVSGGVAGATNATLTFMVGGPEAAVERARPLLALMGKTIVHAGDAGTGQAAKICNNMLLAISMIGTCEAFALAKRLGLDAQKLFDISSKASGQCWSMTSYCPVPGPVPTSPANRDYAPGFAAAMMLKDLRLAREAAAAADAPIPLGAAAEALYSLFCAQGNSGLDFSAIIRMMEGA